MPKRLSKVRLTDRYIAKLRPAEKGQRRTIPDDVQRGLYLRVTDEGVKSFSAVGWCSGRTVRVTIGTYPSTSLAEAREKAGDAIKLMKRGRHPIEEEKQQQAEAERQLEAERRRRADTFRAIAEAFNKRHLGGLRSGKEVWQAIERDLMPEWGDLPIRDITRKDVFALLDRIEDRGTPYARNRRLAAIRRLFNFALERGSVDANPAARIKALPEAKRQRVLTDDEIRALWKVLDATAAPWGPFVKVLLLTAQRRGEVAGMERAELDMEDRDAATWTIGEQKAKNGLAHRVPLAPAVLDVIAGLPEYESDDAVHVFTTTGGKRPISGFTKAKAEIDKASGVKDWVLHDLRRTAATGMAASGVDRLHISRVLNHVDRSVTAIYDRHRYDAEKRRALETWAGRLHAILNPAPAKVIPIRRQSAAGGSRSLIEFPAAGGSRQAAEPGETTPGPA